VLQNPHGRGVGAGLRRLVDYNRFDLTRGCLVRNKRIKESWSAHGNVIKLTEQKGGEWVNFKELAVVKELLALREVYKDREDYGIPETVVQDFIKEKAAENYLVREILSKPSGQPDDLEDEDSNISEISSVSSELINHSDNADEDPFAEVAVN
jgi:hypothetical protein